MKIGRRIYWDKATGNILEDTGEMSNGLPRLPIEEEILTFTHLVNRERSSFDVIQLEYGDFQEDFYTCVGFSVNVETGELLFAYPTGDPAQPPVYQQPLTTEVENLKQRTEDLEVLLAELISGGA